ncbi:UQCC3 factor, partial [Rhinopomastus cyanomelas]|nr:UQCC3 factor [Rhinopomastus cyanomelas]
MEAAKRWAWALARGSLPVGVGVLLWYWVAAGEEQRIETLKALPEITPELLAQRKEHNRLVMAALKEAAETDENVARRAVPWRK